MMFPFLFIFFIPISCQEYNETRHRTYNEAILFNSSLPKYDKKDSPYDIFQEKMTIQIEVGFVVLTKVVEVQQLVSYIVNVVYTWHDKRLAFDPDLLGYNYTIIPSNTIWIPTIDCFNCIGIKKFDKETESNEVLIQSDGTVVISLKASFDTICSTNIEAFPFDTQFCGLDFNAGFSGGERVNLKVEGNDPMILLGTPEWNIYNDKPLKSELNRDSLIGIRFRLVRNPTFYIVLLILPTLIVCTVCLSALTLPLDFTKSARFTMAASGLMALTFLLGIIIQQVPRAKNVPILGKWALMEEFMVFFALMINEPIKVIKQKYFKKQQLTQHTIDFIKFIVIIGSNILATILIFTLPPKPDPNVTL